jgi:hypothetical protein
MRFERMLIQTSDTVSEMDPTLSGLCRVHFKARQPYVARNFALSGYTRKGSFADPQGGAQANSSSA